MMSAPIMKQAADSPLVHRLRTILVVKNMDPNQGSEQHFYLKDHVTTEMHKQATSLPQDAKCSDTNWHLTINPNMADINWRLPRFD